MHLGVGLAGLLVLFSNDIYPVHLYFTFTSKHVRELDSRNVVEANQSRAFFLTRFS